MLLIASAAEAGRSVVSTLVFAHPTDRAYVAEMVDTASRSGAQTSFVQLGPPTDVLESRVVAPSRAATNKIGAINTLRDLLARHDLYTPINANDLQIDNADVPADEVARRIGDYLELEPAG